MTQTNPYVSPNSDVEKHTETDEQIEKVASGQKMIIYAILCHFAGVAVLTTLGPYGLIFSVAALTLAIIGFIRLASGLGYSIPVRILLILLMLVPLISLITLLVLNSKATNRLRKAGYRVGFLGASK